MQRLSDTASLLESKMSYATDEAIWFEESGAAITLLKNVADGSRVATAHH